MALLLHGALYVRIQSVRNLQLEEVTRGFGFDDITRGMGLCCRRRVVAMDDTEVDIPVSHTEIRVCLDQQPIACVTVTPNSLTSSPLCAITRDVIHLAQYVAVKIIRIGITEKKVLGQVEFVAEDILNHPDDLPRWRLQRGGHVGDEGDVTLMDEKGHDTEMSLRLSMHFSPARTATLTPALSDSYFQSRGENGVRLYNNAAGVLDPLYEDIITASGVSYEAPNCFEDMYKCIMEAQRLVYLTGWSFHPDTKLVRNDPKRADTIGELLIKKADAGVSVLLVLYDELTSTSVLPGFASVYDELTMRYFRDSRVRVSHQHNGATCRVGDIIRKAVFSHHQKSLVCDAPHPRSPSRRRLLAFLGGLDLTRGRYDSSTHPLYSTLRSQHRGDFYNPVVDTEGKIGPRLPWHDIHCRVEGPVAYDVTINFMERWRSSSGDDPKGQRLVNLDNEVFDLECPGVESSTWNCQIFRSLTSCSADLDPSRLSTLDTCGPEATERSIQRAIVKAIRAAQSFVYIETQYFCGGSHEWLDESHNDAPNTVPLELTHKILSKIAAGERFFAYIVLPLHPDSDPTDKYVQEMLRWQYRTVQRMYRQIATALSRSGVDASPTDYLSFYCLGTRENDEAPEGLKDPESGSHAEQLRKLRRFMVYVHSKLLIADDAYVVLGSANLNERSLAGDRDTELCVGAFQPIHLPAPGTSLPRGDVASFRTALWVSHTQQLPPEFSDPASVQCVRKLEQIASENWEVYIAKETRDTRGHLMPYPYRLIGGGGVEGTMKLFPDSEAPVEGEASTLFPNILTT